MAVQDFGLPLNLMLACSAAVLVDLEEEGIAMLAAMLWHGPASSCMDSSDGWLQARVLGCNARKVSGWPAQKGCAA